MLFNLIRIILWIIISIIIIIKITKSKIVHKKISCISLIVVSSFLVSLLEVFPPENLFLHFESPESVFNYTHSGQIENIVDGEKSSIIFYSSPNNDHSNYIVPKTDKGYYIPTYFSSKKILHKFGSDGTFDIYNLVGTDDYYIIGTTYTDYTEDKISDNNNLTIIYKTTYQSDNGNKELIQFCSYVKNFNKDYSLIINDKTIKFD